MPSSRASKAGNRLRGASFRATLGLCLLVLGTQTLSAHAADIGCGRDTDNNGTVDTYCGNRVTHVGSPCDKDWDGYIAKRCGGNDYFDTDAKRFPGVLIEDPADSTKMIYLKDDGTLSSSFLKSACPDGTGGTPALALHCYYFDPVSGNNSTGTGSWASPWLDQRAITAYYQVGDRPAGYHLPVAGDWFFVKTTGTFSATYTYNGATTVFKVRGMSGTAANPIYAFVPIPGVTLTWSYSVASPGTQLFRIINDDSDYWIFGLSPGNDFAQGVGGTMFFDGSVDYNRVSNVIVRGDDYSVLDNHYAIGFNGGTGNKVDHSTIYDIESTSYSQGRAGCIVWYKGDLEISHVNCRNTTGTPSDSNGQNCYYKKHGEPNGGIDLIHDNIGENCKGWALGYAGGRAKIERNLFVNTDYAIFWRDTGGAAYYQDSTIRNNTWINATAGIFWEPLLSYNANYSAASDNCTGDTPFGTAVFQNNILQDNAGSYSSTARAFMLGLNTNDPLVASATGKFQSVANVIYNASLTPNFGIFERTTGGNGCGASEYGSIGSTRTLAQAQSDGWDTGSVISDPSCSTTTGVCTATAARGKGAIPYY